MSAHHPSFAPIIKEIGRGTKGARSLSRDEARELFDAILTGEVPDMELGAILIALRVKGEDFAELEGFKAALDARCQHVTAPAGPRCVVLPTYNGARKQANLMPLVAQLLAREGIPVLIQGRHDFDSRVSPFELLEALDIHPAASVEDASTQLQTRKLACLKLDQLSPGLDRLLALRPRLGVRNSGHTLAKLLDPAPDHSVRVVAVTHPEYLERMEEFLIHERATAMLMRGTEGEAYASPRRRPRLLGFFNGEARELFAQQSMEAPVVEQDACSVAQNTSTLRAMLEDREPVPQAIRDQVTALVTLARS